jgi:PAS domain S-box-containing protein
MLDVIQQRDIALQRANQELEQHVAQRTSALENEIAERILTESELRRKTAFLEALVDSSVDGVLVVSSAWQVLLLSQQMLNMWKLPAFMNVERNYWDILEHVMSRLKDPEEYRHRIEHLYARPDETSRDEIEFADGTILDRHSAPVRGKDGQYYGRLWTFRDITERKHTEEALLRAKETLSSESQVLRALIDNMPDFMYVKDAKCRFLLANVSVARQMGAKTPEDLIGKTDFDYYPPDLAKTFFDDEQRIIRTGQAEVNREETGMDASGKKSQILTTQVPIRDKNGRVVSLAGIGRDITELKKTGEALSRAKEALSHERQVLRALIDNVPDCMYVKDTTRHGKQR